MIDRLLRHGKTLKTMILITCEVIALIISLEHYDDKDIPKSIFYSANRSNYNMTLLRAFLFVSTLVIFAVSIYVVIAAGINWPTTYFSDLLNLDWRSQFNTDLLICLCLFAIWVTWREGFTPKGFLFGFLSLFWGGMFGCPYLLLATYKANGNPKVMLLGVHTDQ
jgi:hypothetical protein